MSKIRDKNLLFYSIHPNDTYSRDFRAELERNPNLKQQFIQICVNDPKIEVPPKIKQMNQVPIVIVPEFPKPVMGPEALSWLRNGGFQEKANGSHEYGTLDDDRNNYTFLEDEATASEYNQSFHN